MVGREVLVMIEGKVADENAYVGRTYKDAPNVDGYDFYQYRRRIDEWRFCKSPRDRCTGI